MIPFILGALLVATLTLPAFARLLRQRDAARVRGDLALAELDEQIEETGYAREQWLLLYAESFDLRHRIAQLEAEALPKAPNWGAAPATWRAS